MVKVTGKWFSFASYGTAMGVVSLSYLFGDAAARRFMGWLLDAGLDWREVFGVAAGVLFAFFVVNWLWLKESPLAIGQAEPPANPLNVFGAGGEDDAPPSMRELLVPLLTSPVFVVVCLLSLGLTLLRETFNTWSAIYFHRGARARPAPRPPIAAPCFRCWAACRCWWPDGWAIGWGRGAGPP